MLRQKGYAAINVAGLSIGIAATLIILIYVVDEFSFDKFHKDATEMYRVGFAGRLQGNEFNSATSPAPLADAVRKEIPEVTNVIRFGLWRTMPMAFGEKSFTEKHMLIADSNFFKFFDFRLTQGNPETVLSGTNKIVITESVAKKYFGSENPIGKIMLRGSNKTACEVTGIAEDAPKNSHISYDVILSGESWEYMSNQQWTSNNIYTYINTTPGADPEKVKSQLNGMVEKYMGAELEKFLGFTFKQFLEQGNKVGLFPQAFLDIHLQSNLSEEIIPNGDVQYLYVFGAIAIFIILIACINFMNLSTARSANRAKEVGVRKTIGAERSRLVGQFLSESLLYSVFSMLVALMIIAIALEPFNYLAGKALTFSIFTNPVVILSLVAFTIILGVLAGSYPALYLTSFNPTDVLKGKIRSGFKNSALRNVLVVFQFMISIALIFGSLVVYQQLKYMQEKNIGFDKENIVDLLHTFALDKNAQAFKNEINSHPEFKGASFANRLPPNIDWNSAFRKGGSEQDFLLSLYYVDHDHLTTMGYTMAEGRFFSREFASDSMAIVLNETTYKQMDFKNFDEATVLSYNYETPRSLKVIGVIKDFNFESLKSSVKPIAILLGREPNGEMAIRLSPGNTQKQIKLLESIFKKYAPGSPFEYSFLDQNFDALFRAEQRMSKIILIFTILAIGIACLGLLGLATFTAEQRAKEMSIRKVMGATSPQVMILLSKDFTVLVAVAFVVASPLAWYMAESWLEGFANRINLTIWFVVISGVVALFIAMITVSFQAVKAAQENPVNAMRSE